MSCYQTGPFEGRVYVMLQTGTHACGPDVKIPLEDLALYGHCDAALQNAKRKGSQAGFLVAAGDRCINEGVEGQWGLVGWRSGRLRRVVASSLSAEASLCPASAMGAALRNAHPFLSSKRCGLLLLTRVSPPDAEQQLLR